MIHLIMTAACLTTPIQNDMNSGIAYMESVYVGTVLAGKYPRGSDEWDRKNKEWLDSDKDEPYPEDLNDIDGIGYHDSKDTGQHPEDCK